jgi:hypothetical protein
MDNFYVKFLKDNNSRGPFRNNPSTPQNGSGASRRDDEAEVARDAIMQHRQEQRFGLSY